MSSHVNAFNITGGRFRCTWTSNLTNDPNIDILTNDLSLYYKIHIISYISHYYWLLRYVSYVIRTYRLHYNFTNSKNQFDVGDSIERGGVIRVKYFTYLAPSIKEIAYRSSMEAGCRIGHRTYSWLPPARHPPKRRPTNDDEDVIGESLKHLLQFCLIIHSEVCHFFFILTS